MAPAADLDDDIDKFEFFLEKDWSDGLPVVTPTRERVERMLASTRRERDLRGGERSCTLCSVHDTVELEKRGIPATVVITQAFHNACLFQFKAKGMEGHAYVELPIR